jgi:hypothetical protein
VAILKIHYTRKAGAAKENIRYIGHRPGKDGARVTRTLWNSDGKMTRKEAYQMIDGAEKGSIFFTIIISPCAKTEDTRRDLSFLDLAERTMAALQAHIPNPIQYVAALHDDHTQLRHTHILAVVKGGGIYNKERQAMHQAVTQAALEQRRERDLVWEYRIQQQREKEAEWEY